MKIADNLNIDAEVKEQIEELFSDMLGSDDFYDTLIGNLKTSTDTLEVLIWGVMLMKHEGVLHKDHLGALVSYWQSEHYSRQMKTIDLLKVVYAQLGGGNDG